MLVVEDEPALASLLCGALTQGGFVVDAAGDIAGAEACLRLAAYDAMLLDRGLPDGDGLAMLRRLRSAGNTLPVLILTARDAPPERVHGLDAGADDYVVKPFHLPEVLSRMRALLRRPNAALGVRLEAGNLMLDTPTRVSEVAGVPLPLSARETSLLELLLRRLGRVASRESLDAGLYGFDTPTGPNAMEVAVCRLRRRLHDAGATARIHTVRGVGYMMTPE